MPHSFDYLLLPDGATLFTWRGVSSVKTILIDSTRSVSASLWALSTE